MGNVLADRPGSGFKAEVPTEACIKVPRTSLWIMQHRAPQGCKILP